MNQLLQRILLHAGQFHNIRFNAVLLCPLGKFLRLHAALIHADLFPVKGGRVIHADRVVAGVHISIILFLTHGQGRIQYGFPPVLLKGNTA